MKFLRLAFISAAVLLATGGGVSSSSLNLGRFLSLAGYLLFAIILIILIMIEIRLWIDRKRLNAASEKVGFEP